MAFGFYDGVTNFIPDRGMTYSDSPKMLKADFGDGYQQRLSDGINNKPKVFQITFKDRLKADTEDIMNFFELKGGVTSFTFRYDKGDGAETQIKVVCPTWKWAANYDPYHTVTATLMEVFEP